MGNSLAHPGDGVGGEIKEQRLTKGWKEPWRVFFTHSNINFLREGQLSALEFTKSVYSFTHLKFLLSNCYIKDNDVERKVNVGDQIIEGSGKMGENGFIMSLEAKEAHT